MSADPSVFRCTSYKEFLREKAGSKSQRKGIKSAMANALRCQPTYISQILHGSAELSLEQAEALSRFFALSDDEAEFFLLLVQRDRAGTAQLRAYFERKVEERLTQRLVLSRRFGKHEALSAEDQSRYYSTWVHAAVHIALTVPELRSPAAIAHYFGLGLKQVSSALEFLVQSGLATSDEHGFRASSRQIRLGNESHHILKHHSNWRVRALESLEREDLSDLHYSAVVSLSRADAIRIKEAVMDALKSQLSVIQASKEEAVYAYTIDFFSLRR